MTHNVAIREVAVTPLRQFARRIRSASALRSFGLFSTRYTRCLNASDDVGELGRNVIVYFDQEFNFEAGVQVSAPFASAGEVRSSHTPSGRAATTVHTGPYAQLPKAHVAVRAWCAENGHLIEGRNWEVYGHWNDDPAQLSSENFSLLE